jgi:class 3 adenylate cyclase
MTHAADVAWLADAPEMDSLAAIPPPEGEVTIVFSDITRAASLWERQPAPMRDATLLHNGVLRSLLAQYRGHEAVFTRYCPAACRDQAND